MGKILNTSPMDEFEYSVITKTFLRPEKVDKCLRSISELYLKPKEVVVADDGESTREKDQVYRTL
jgi:glycosyltransferase involved in cell wall biosynthesis